MNKMISPPGDFLAEYFLTGPSGHTVVVYKPIKIVFLCFYVFVVAFETVKDKNLGLVLVL